MAKYNYWHVVTKVSKEWGKHNPKMKVGLILTHSYKKDDEGVDMMDLKEGKEYPGAYILGYLGRVLKGTPGEELCEILEKWIDEKGFREIVEKHDKERDKKKRREIKKL